MDYSFWLRAICQILCRRTTAGESPDSEQIIEQTMYAGDGMLATLPTQQRIDEIARKLAPDVVRIRFRVAPDWSEHPAMYFRVLLSDHASRKDRLAATTDRIRAELFNQLGLDSLDHIPYFRFRSESEQASLKDPAWD